MVMGNWSWNGSGTRHPKQVHGPLNSGRVAALCVDRGTPTARRVRGGHGGTGRRRVGIILDRPPRRITFASPRDLKSFDWERKPSCHGPVSAYHSRPDGDISSHPGHRRNAVAAVASSPRVCGRWGWWLDLIRVAGRCCSVDLGIYRSSGSWHTGSFSNSPVILSSAPSRPCGEQWGSWSSARWWSGT